MSVLSVADLRPGRTRVSGDHQADSEAAAALTALPKVRRRRRGLMAGIIGLLLIALGAVLMINIHVATSQYQVVQMQNDYQSLVHENEALSQQVQVRQSPQALSDAAVTLGMVMPASAGTFDVDTSMLTSGAKEAASDQRPTNFVSAPHSVGADAGAPVDVAEEASGAPRGLLGAGALHTLTAAESGQNGTEANQSTDSGRTAPTPGGGTIPAPGLD